MKRLSPERVLIVYPRKDIQEGWDTDAEKFGYEGSVNYTTYKSLHKHIDQEWDLVILDEIHEASKAQLAVINKLKAKSILGLSGTITRSTERTIYQATKINICYEYTIEQAVIEGILCDYKIILHKVPLSKRTFGTETKNESQRFSNLLYVYEQLTLQKKDAFHIYLKQIQLIQGSHAKIQKTKDLLRLWKGERVLVFCGTTAVADALDIQAYHSLRREESIFRAFCDGSGEDNHLATIKMAQAGVTIKPINKGLINYTSGNPEDTAQKICRFLGFEYDNPGKIAEIHMVVSTEKFELDRIATALMFFDPEKIFYA